ncbi:acyl-CoA carboxylase subunit beta [Candidatus Poriferisodalis sp.]|uniref:acyl-CoA carboxylase subunit beta n=1 Tax=Candidatus Poriferisodalis sp. TaxID=3101277 RepID=UPI003B014B98
MDLQLRAGAHGHVTAGIATIGERAAMLISADSAHRRGALSPADSETIVAGLQAALAKRLPVVLMLSSSGADAHHGVAALHGWGEAARVLVQCSGVVPVVAGVQGQAISGIALLIGLADAVVMSDDACAFVSGPVPVREMTGVAIGPHELGGAPIHATASGTASAVTHADAVLDKLTEILSYLPSHCDELPPRISTSDPRGRPTPRAGELLPGTPTGAYDVRDIIVELVDNGWLTELRAQWAPNLVTGFASLGGWSVGVLANQPMSVAGTLDIAASQKGARFVNLCDAFGLPLVTLVDTPGFYPGKDLEWRGMIRHGAQLAFAYARATVPRVAVVLRKSYGGAYIVMDSKTMGNDVYLAWPSAELAVMGASQAAQILRRGADASQLAQYVAEYEDTYLNPYVAAERGYVDGVIDPADTRRELIDTLGMLATKRERLPRRRHDNAPL